MDKKFKEDLSECSKKTDLPSTVNTHYSTHDFELKEDASVKFRVKIVLVFFLVVVLIGLNVFFGLATVRCKESKETMSRGCKEQYDDDLFLREKQKLVDKLGPKEPEQGLDLGEVPRKLWSDVARVIETCVVAMDKIDVMSNGTHESVHDVIGFTVDPDCLKKNGIVTQEIAEKARQSGAIVKGGYQGFGPIPFKTRG